MQLLITLLFFSLTCAVFSQDNNETDFSEFSLEISDLINDVINSRDSSVRVSSSEKAQFKMEELLSAKNSFTHQLDAIRGISVINSPDSKFRIITWQLYRNRNNYSYIGYVQNADGTFEKLLDKSDDMRTVEFSTFKAKYWYGALYYNIKKFKNNGEDCYLLFGFDAFEFYNKRKVLDVLSFNEDGEARFGKSVIEIQDAYKRTQTVKRYLLEYSSSVNVSLNYSEEMDMVIYDHLIYGTPLKEAGPSNVPDGSYCGLKLNKEGVWKYVDKVHKDDPNNVLIDATSFDKMLNQEKSQKGNRDIFGRSKSKG